MLGLSQNQNTDIDRDLHDQSVEGLIDARLLELAVKGRLGISDGQHMDRNTEAFSGKKLRKELPSKKPFWKFWRGS